MYIIINFIYFTAVCLWKIQSISLLLGLRAIFFNTILKLYLCIPSRYLLLFLRLRSFLRLPFLNVLLIQCISTTS